MSKHDCWSRKGRTHRFKIRTAEGVQWISLPIRTEDRKKPISEVRLDLNADPLWLPKTLRTIAQAYRNSIYFDHYEPEFEELFRLCLEQEKLLDAINVMNSKLWELLEWKPERQKISLVSEVTEESYLQAETIFWEFLGTSFQHQFGDKTKPALGKHPVYRQHFGGFEPDCCVVDVLFELGPEWYKVWDEL
jgi:hypothetical protein